LQKRYRALLPRVVGRNSLDALAEQRRHRNGHRRGGVLSRARWVGDEEDLCREREEDVLPHVRGVECGVRDVPGADHEGGDPARWHVCVSTSVLEKLGLPSRIGAAKRGWKKKIRRRVCSLLS